MEVARRDLEEGSAEPPRALRRYLGFAKLSGPTLRAIAKAVEDPNTPPRDLAALTKRLVEVQRDIEAIDARGEQEQAGGRSVADEPFDAQAL